MTGSTPRRRTFGPLVLGGLVAGALGAVAGSNAWVVEANAATRGNPVPGVSLADPVVAAGQMPLALALNLVVLAAWGVLLVTRGRIRRSVALIGALAAAGQVVVVFAGFFTLDGRVGAAVREQLGGAGAVATNLTGWFVVAAVAAAVSIATTVLALAWAPQWPEMGRRYDAPGAAAAEPATVPPAERDNLDLWKSMDEGHDPTA